MVAINVDLNTKKTNTVDMDALLTEAGLEYTKEDFQQNGKTGAHSKYYGCLFDSGHTGKDAAIIQFDSGTIIYKCLHNSCNDKKWKDCIKFFQDKGVDTGKYTNAPPKQNEKEDISTIEFCTAFDIYQKNPQPKWIIKDFIPKGESTLISSSGGLGKSMFSLYLAHLLATKLEIHKPDHGGNLCIDFNEYLLFDEFPINKSGISSLFLQTENSNPQINFRLRKIAGDNIEPLKRLCFPVINGSAITSGQTFIEEIGKEKSSKKFEKWFETLINTIQDQTKQKIELVWLDPLISFCGCNENDNAEVRKNLDVLTVMAHKCEVTPIVIHHNAKNTEKDKDNTGYRGASAILDWTRNLITMNKTEIPEPFFIDGKMKTRKVPAINVKNVMSNVGKQFKDFKIRMDDNFRFTRLKEEAIDPATLKEINNVIQALKDMDNCFAESQNDLASKYSALTGKTNPTGKKYIKLAVEYDFIKEVNDGSKTYGYKLKE